jgi:hypothetical protein
MDGGAQDGLSSPSGEQTVNEWGTNTRMKIADGRRQSM